MRFSVKSNYRPAQNISNMNETEICARCGKELEWHEQKMVFWNKQLKKGYIRWYVMASSHFGKRKDFPQYAGKKLCQACAHAVFNGSFLSEASEGLPDTAEETGVEDFGSLNAFLKENGVVAEAFGCPKCSGMLKIPEKGKVLICKHCGAPIRPEDIYEKIKPLIE
jgi:hypothetical protein